MQESNNTSDLSDSILPSSDPKVQNISLSLMCNILYTICNNSTSIHLQLITISVDGRKGDHNSIPEHSMLTSKVIV